MVGRVVACSLPAYERYVIHWGANISNIRCGYSRGDTAYWRLHTGREGRILESTKGKKGKASMRF